VRLGSQIEETYFDPKANRSKKFPTIYDPASLYLSVIVPAYNEQDRIQYMLDETFRYLLARSKRQRNFTWEIIVVDDGSSDRTIVVVRDYVMRYGTDRIRLLRLVTNRGKGGAVRQGMMVARGQRLLMVDADGATRFSDVEQLESSLDRLCRSNNEGFGIAVGSRVQVGDDTKAAAERTLFRWFLQQAFHIAVSVLCVSGVQDTQCGFKLFSRASAVRLFPTQRINRWAFDVELLYLAQKMMNMPIEEVPVNWVEIAGSKVEIVGASLSMVRDMVIIRLCYGCKFWKIESIALRKRA
jgi:dolichyl-phosphate beta-glucosyltransferase